MVLKWFTTMKQENGRVSHPGHKWTQGDVEYTMMSDGTIHGDNGTIWATTGTQNIIKRNDLTIRWYIQRLWINRTIETGSQNLDLQLKAKFVHSTKIICFVQSNI